MEVSQPNPSDMAFKYFDLYGSMRAHKVMLEDMARMRAYHSAIFKTKSEMFKDKVILDVGCGTGVLSVWAAKAGARRVYGVEAGSANKLAKQLIQHSNVSDVVTILHSKVEDIDLDEPVDVIVSEWMGSLLLKESMFDSVAYARDRWLKSNGLMLPSYANILLGLYSPSEEHDHTRFVREKLEKEITEWEQTVTDLQSLDIDYSDFTDDLGQELSDYFLGNAVRVNYLSQENLAAKPQQVFEFDCATVDPEILVQFSQEFQFTVDQHTEIKGFLGWFTTGFPNGVILNTGPGPTYNHWGQQLYPFKNAFKVVPGDQVKGIINFRRDYDESRLNVVEFKYQLNTGIQHTAVFSMGSVEHMHQGSKSVLFSPL
ncbi:50S ribosomal protein L11 methyltransferase [Leptolyngbya cf. ectocarpi LEGE 11479]|uniref:50S ribosomal protein L11 methyltransferase n=1 Tax=Leptolyngbya cf. ectocarpi LEGE 11479 TaxID=1828722 RepID=A0A928ZVV3_LEPEC|nr:class I SAM-dependent methyltransferase [Leptolyngbya ectocarpi]MBE9068325.1 50S ribosomal protein L11 methyltransferase [Leptolyngbya cf. ectocarpi LEGE 11479]